MQHTILYCRIDKALISIKITVELIEIFNDCFTIVCTKHRVYIGTSIVCVFFSYGFFVFCGLLVAIQFQEVSKNN